MTPATTTHPAPSVTAVARATPPRHARSLNPRAWTPGSLGSLAWCLSAAFGEAGLLGR